MSRKFRRIAGVLLVIQAFSWAMVGTNAMGSEHGTGVIQVHSRSRPVEFDGMIMSVDYDKHLIIVRERKIVVGQFRFGGELMASQLMDAGGAPAEVDRFCSGQWVAVRGYAVSKSEIVAVSVQAAARYLKKDLRRIDKLERLHFLSPK